MPSTVDDYSDLPQWVRPHARLALASVDTYGRVFSATLVTVVRITEHRIVVTTGTGSPIQVNRRDNKYGYDRLRARGDFSGELVERTPEVIAFLRVQKEKERRERLNQQTRDRIHDLLGSFGQVAKKLTMEEFIDRLEAITDEARRGLESINGKQRGTGVEPPDTTPGG